MRLRIGCLLQELSVALVFSVLLAGCSSPGFIDGKPHNPGEVALVTDVTVLHAGRLGAFKVIVAENMAVANQMANAAAGSLIGKGYRVRPAVTTTGMGFAAGAQPLEVVPDGRFMTHQAPNLPPYGIFAQVPFVDIPLLYKLHHHPVDTPVFLPMPGGKPQSMLVITARGKSAATQPEWAAHMQGILLTMGAAGMQSAAEFAPATIALNISLYEGSTGKLLWQAEDNVKAEPDVGHLVSVLQDMLKKLPPAAQDASAKQ